ncbi:MAG: Asp-tRNA(Asn)/Glu-tRNA(Gln) amidotransferase GatCAB subunit B [Crocinitomicaceae bacterium]|nr:Asp-tRNA(Asn)/Glu-tRNA(Gln) amidotransferase GatCAB subunit B [Crocinitomicaceae bacterium]|tara:strand:- start:50557 stop:52017 length:1461 start_codon:yes stop_codon:yes gene_type:complete
MSPEIRNKYQAIIGLEVHAQMLTKSKAYSSDINQFGDKPNNNVSIVTMAHPGSLPKMNNKTIEFAIKLGLACNAKITQQQNFSRKNYFYPDLPKGYQITQDLTPICTDGEIYIKDDNGNEKPIKLTRIHMEEDAGKSIHDIDIYDTLVDLNRAGVPLIEIVSEPDLRTSKEAYNYLTEIRKLVRYLDICDGNMEEGSLRCDANVSVMLIDSKEFGRKVEVKNMNSIRNVQKAIEYEINRQIEKIENGEIIRQETRSYDALKNITISMRSKEDANDYRYFPEPDLQPLFINESQINKIKADMPMLPRDLFIKYTKEYQLSEYDAYNLTDSKDIALYYEEIIKHTKNYKSAANLMMGDVKSYLNQYGIEIINFPIYPKTLADLITLIDNGKISSTIASQKIFPTLLENPNKDPLKIAEEMNLIQDSDENEILSMITDIIRNNNIEAERYKNGEKQLIGFFMGQLMKISKGKANPKSANKLIRETLDKL